MRSWSEKNRNSTLQVTDPEFIEVLPDEHTRGGAFDDAERILRSAVRDKTAHRRDVEALEHEIAELESIIDECAEEAQIADEARKKQSAKLKKDNDTKMRNLRNRLMGRLERCRKVSETALKA